MQFPCQWLSLNGLLCTCLGVPLAAMLITYITSWLKGIRLVKADGKCEPPMLPYWLPYLQHLIPFLYNPGALYTAGRHRFPNSPFTLLLAGTRFHVFSASPTINHVFSRSRKFSFEPIMASMMENGVDLPIPDRAKFMDSATPAGVPKFITENHNIWVANLSGQRLDEIMEIYMRVFHRILGERVDMNARDWISIELHRFLRRLIFETSTATFFGPRIAECWPCMWDDWRRYDDATYIGVRSNLAYYLQPGAYAARERMFRAFEEWILDAGEGEWDDADGVWSERWGFRMNWERDRLARQCGFSLRGRACLQASFLFVIVTNAAPMASWFAYCAVRVPECLASYRSAATSALGTEALTADFPQLDLAALKQQPYINGLWLEALRLGTASAAARVVMEDTELEGFHVRKGSVILMPAQLMHFNEEVFPEPRKVVAERWRHSDTEKLKRQKNTLRPFGGGTSLCSGRHVAEHEIIGVITTLLLLFDVKFERDAEEWQFNPRSIGVMAPKRDLRVFLRRRSALGK